MWISLLLSSALAHLIVFDNTYLNPIEMTSVHLADSATYTFNLKTTVTLPKYYVFNIAFPAEYETITVGSASITTGSTYTAATLTTTTLVASFQLPFEIREDQTFRVKLTGVANPVAYRLVGPFNIYVNQRDDINKFAQNKLYTTVAFIGAIPNAVTASINISYTGFDATVDTLTTYALRIALQEDVDKGSWFQVTLPTGWSKADGNDPGCKLDKVATTDSDISGTFVCSSVSNVITIKGLSADIIRANHDQFYIYIVIPGILNPVNVKALNASNFIIRVIAQETTRILQNHSAPTPQIVKGQVSSISVTPVYSYTKTINGNTEAAYDIKFTPAHQLPDLAQIKLTLSGNAFMDISSLPQATPNCVATTGFNNNSTGAYPTCTRNSSTEILITGIGAAPALTALTVRVAISINSGSGVNLAVTSYYYDAATTNLYEIDQGTASVLLNSSGTFSTLDIGATPLVFTALTTGAAGNISVVFRPTVSMAVGTTVRMYFPAEFTAGVASCQQTVTGGSGTLAMGSCQIQSEQISATTVTDALPNNNNTSITFGSLTHPVFSTNAENLYTVCIEVVASGGSPNFFHCKILSINASDMSASSSFTGWTGSQGFNIPFYISYTAPSTITHANSYVYVKLNGSLYNGLSIGTKTGQFCQFPTGETAATCSVNASAGNTQTNITFENLSRIPDIANPAKVIGVYPSAGTACTYDMQTGINYRGFVRVAGIVSGVNCAVSGSHNALNNFKLGVRGNLEINATTSLSVTVETNGAVVDAGQKIFISLPGGWNVSAITAVNIGSNALSNIEYFQNDYRPGLLAEITQAIDDAIVAAGSNVFTITFSPITNPSPVGTGTSGNIEFSLISGTTMLQYGSWTIDQSTPGAIDDAVLSVNVDKTGFPLAHYSFSFTNITEIPLNGKIVITFPAAYTSFGQASCSLQLANYTDEPTCNQSGSTMTLSSLPLIAAASNIIAIVKWIPNPSSSTVTGFTLQTKTSTDGLLDEATGISHNFTEAFSVGGILVNDIIFDPATKQAQKTDFTITFQSDYFLPKDATVQVTIPSDFNSVSSINCYASVPIQSCVLQGNTLTALLGDDVQALSSLSFYANQSYTVPNVTVTQKFSVSVAFSGTTIVQTGSKGQSVEEFKPITAASSFTVKEVAFVPQNQGEPATYRFNIIAPKNISQDDSIIVWFPSNFDPTLTTQDEIITCWGEPQEFIGAILSCEVGMFGKVTITGHKDIEKDFPFNIYIGGVINPAKGKLGSFRLGIENEDEEATHYRVNIGNLWTTQTPGILRIREYSTTQPYARIKNTFNFEFSISSDLPSSQDKGRIWIDFPQQFVLKNLGSSEGWEYPCTTSIWESNVQLETNWNDNVQCINYDSNRIVVFGGKATEAKETRVIKLSIEQVPGPSSLTRTDVFKIMTYDGYSGKVLDKSSALLSIPVSVDLDLLGEDFDFTAAETITVRRGTASSLISMSTTSSLHPMRVYLKVTGVMPLLSAGRIYPSNLLLWQISDQSLNFRVSVPVDTTPGRYALEWTKSGDDFDSASVGDEIYTDFAPTSVIVNYEKSKVMVSTISNVPTPGNSYPITVTLEFPPYEELYVTPRQITSTQSGISFSPHTLSFGPGEYTKDFIIIADETAVGTSLEISFELGGSDQDAYEEPENGKFQLTGVETTVPNIDSLNYDASRRSVTFNTTTSEGCIIFYQIELRYTPEPEPEDLIAAYWEGKASWATSWSSSTTTTFSVNELAAGTSYVLYAVAQDRSGNVSPLAVLNFTTNPDYASVKFAIDFDPNDILVSQQGIQTVFKPELAKVLSVLPSRLNVYSVSEEASRRLQNDDPNSMDVSGLTNRALVIELANNKYSDMISPLDAVQNMELAKLNKYLDKINLDATLISSAFEMTNQAPTWTKVPNIWQISGSSISITAKLNIKGYIHMVILDNGGPAPTSQQIVWGLDGFNVPARHVSGFYDGGIEAIQITFTGLIEETNYDVYISASNNYPGNNKAVSQTVYDYIAVRTDIACSECELFFVADDDLDYGMALTVMGIFWLLV